MRREVDHFGGPEQVKAGQSHADNAVLDQVSDDAGRPGAADRNALLNRLAKLAPWHPSAIQPGDRAAADRRWADRPDRDLPGSVPLESGWRQGSGRDWPAAPDSPPGPDRPPRPDPPEGSFWDKVPWFRSLWRDHVERWPERQSEPGGLRPDDRPGSWRGQADRYLSPERNAEADEQIAFLRRPEEAVTSLLMQIERENPLGGVLVGLDHRLKDPDRLKEKIADKMAAKGGMGIAKAAATIDDAVRYTFCLGDSKYVTGHGYVRDRLEAAGYKMTYCKNHWLDDPQYKGVNSRWQSPEGGRFELQFHTRESFYAKEQLTHPSYKRLRSPGTTWAERLELRAFERVVSSAVPRPADVERIANYRGGSR